MKAILRILYRDVSQIFKNYAALIVVLALCVLPSLYAWFNIKASWDPYSQSGTGKIKVGVVNEDKGAKLQGKTINLGDQIVTELKKNKQLGWQFVSKEKAMDALKMEKYYAVITIPSDFSKDLSSITTEDIKKGTIVYTVNEKMNAIAPKLTDKGVTSLQNMISKTVVETVSDKLLHAGQALELNMEKQVPKVTEAYNILVTVKGKFGEVNSTITTAEDGVKKAKVLLTDAKNAIPKINTLLENSISVGNEVKEFLTISKNTSTQIAPVIIKDLEFISTVSDTITERLIDLKETDGLSKEQLNEKVTTLNSQVTNLNRVTSGLSSLLGRFNGLSQKKPFTSYIDRLDENAKKLTNVSKILTSVTAKLENGELDIEGLLENAIAVQRNVSGTIKNVKEELEKNIEPLLNTVFENTIKLADDAMKVLEGAKKKLPQVSNLITTAFTAIDKGEKGIEYAKQVVPKAEGLVNELVVKMKDANDNKDIQELVRLLKVDVSKRTDFLGNPIVIHQQSLYPMENYGTSMTPFYTVLCLWVGILLLTSIFTVEAYGDYKPYQIYFGKLLFFVLITIVQAIVVCLGDLYLLKIYCKHPLMFVGVNLLTSILFTLIVYSLVSVFGNVGKVVGIILLVLQVAGSGGTFPVQLTPRFFQLLNPYLPFTYCISLNREAIGGIVSDVVLRDIAAIVDFGGLFLLIGIVFKKPINKLLEKFVVRFKESRLGE